MQTFIDETGNPLEAPLVVTLHGRHAIAIESIEEAVTAVANYRDEFGSGTGMGAAKYYSIFAGRVFAKAPTPFPSSPKRVAQIHYDGTVEMLSE
jgi:hypothetical protein